MVEHGKGLVHVTDKVMDFTGQFLAHGQVYIQRIDNGFIVNVTTVSPQPMQTPFGQMQQLQGTQRALFCSTVDDVVQAIVDLLQMPWRPAEPDQGGTP